VLPSKATDPDNCFEAMMGFYYKARELDDVATSAASFRDYCDSDFSFVANCFLQLLSCPIHETGYRVRVYGDATNRQKRDAVGRVLAWYILNKVFSPESPLPCAI
jgi:hypothetical protein